MKSIHGFFLTHSGFSINRWLITLTLTSVAGCDMSPVKDEKALAQVHSIGVCLVASTAVRLEGSFAASLTTGSPTTYMVLLSDHVDALDKAILSNSTETLSFARIESITEGVSSLTASTPEEFATQKIAESDNFSGYESRRNSSPALAARYSKDAILWISVDFDTAKIPSEHFYEGPLSPLISWGVELYGRDGRQLFANRFRKAAGNTVGNFSETETERSILIDRWSYAEANRTLAVDLSKDGIGSLTGSISKAGAAK